MFAPEIFELLLHINKLVRAEVPLVLEQLEKKSAGEKLQIAIACSLCHSVEVHELQQNSVYTAVGEHRNLKITSLFKNSQQMQTRMNKSRKTLCTLIEEPSDAVRALASS